MNHFQFVLYNIHYDVFSSRLAEYPVVLAGWLPACSGDADPVGLHYEDYGCRIRIAQEGSAGGEARAA